jgi:hypothetical protein
MVSLRKALMLFVPIVVSVLLVNVSIASLSSSKYVSSFGAIHYSGITVMNFETDDCFKCGIDGNGTGYMLYGTEYPGTVPYWSRGGWGMYEYPTKILFKPSTSMVFRGLQSGNLSVVDPSLEGSRRLEVLHDWDPHSEYLWNVGWFYFPSTFEPIDTWIAFHRIVYERMWDPSRAIYYQYFQITLSCGTDGRSATNGQQIYTLNLGKGNIDNNNDGAEETWLGYGADVYSNTDSHPWVPDSWLTRKPGFQVIYDRWFKVVSLVFRNMTDFNNGYIKVWIDGELIWDVQGVRTVGIDPAILGSIDPLAPEPQGYLSSGFGLYTEVGSAPKTIFVDDVIISDSSEVWLAP